ncbi:unnamed protein product [Sphagnum troendelagicum]|uniref:Uncharacterized protein n=1 Tax=Sphagnum troendelagicum TaxID=128251 RepID=A0ABP0UK20_9BRYO
MSIRIKPWRSFSPCLSSLLGLFFPVSFVSLSPFLSSCRKRAPITAGWLVGACKEEMDPLPSPRKISNSTDCLSSNLDFSDHKGDMHFSDQGLLLHTISL